MSDSPLEYISFVIQGRHYGLPMCVIREITKPLPITELVGAAPRYLGLSNLRGKIVGLIDPSEVLGQGRQEARTTSRWLILRSDQELPQVAIDAGETTGPEAAAILVERVTETFIATPGDFHPAPSSNSGQTSDLLRGVSEQKQGLTTVLNAARLVGAEEPANSP